ncbi:MAG: cytidylate kinase-like family protein [Clostridiales bacterium]|nr:cytidylate kinase-like family protein [Clostridiales bacterium]
MKYKYITIEREYGSGATRIAEELGKKCGIPCYGEEILEIVAKENGTTVDRIEQYEEHASGSFIYSIYMMSKLTQGEADLSTREGDLHLAEQKVIRRLAGEGSAVFIGHCADSALEDRQGVLRVFIKSDHDDKISRCIKEYGIPERDAETVARRFDRKRANYYQINTGLKWHDERNYDIILDSGKLGIDGCVAALSGLLGK